MSSLQTHTEDGLLLRYLDGELPGRKSRQVRGHLEACWQCRAAAEELGGAIADCVHYRRDVLQTYLPEPPAPWSDLSAGFARIDSEVGGESWIARLGQALAAPPARWALSAAAALLLAAGLYYQFHETPSVQAATLLKRAVAAAAAHPAAARPVRMRANVKNTAAVPDRLRAAHFNPDPPLSARSYQEWRDGLSAKQDAVETVPDPDTPSKECYRIRTVGAEGDLAMASMMLRMADLHPVAEHFEFRNREWVEYNEISDASTTDGGTPADTRLDAPTRPTVPSRSAALPSGNSASISEELRVLAALHEIGADLGDPVEVQLAGGRVQISGVGLPPQRQRDIKTAIAGIPNVIVNFAESSGAATATDSGVEAQGPKPSGIQARVEQKLGGRAEFERFSGQLLDAVENAMSRAYALRSLAQRFPAGTEMSAQDRAVLADLAREHLKVLSSQFDDLRRTLAPVLVSLGGSSAQGSPVNRHVDWQSAAEDAFRSAQRAEVLLSTLLGVTPEQPNAHIPADLLAAFADLRASLDDCQRLL